MCTQQSADGRRSVLLSSPAGASLSDRVSALFGQKLAASLLPLRPTPPSEERRAEFGLGTVQTQPEVSVEVRVRGERVGGEIGGCRETLNVIINRGLMMNG